MIYAVGDIHGEYWKLVHLLDKLPLEADDRLVFVGDYIDRGPQSCDVLDLLLALRKSCPGTVFLRGNHEQMMLDARAHRHDFAHTALWMGNGGAETMDSYPRGGRGWIERVPEEHWRFLEDTTLELWQGAYVFVHAGFLPPGAAWPYPEDPRLWVREEFLRSSHDFGATVVFGHTPQKSGRPLVLPGRLGVDTAVAYGGPLTAVGLVEDGSGEPAVYQV